MKSFFLVAALTMSTAALAQGMPQGEPMNAPAPPAPDAMAAPAPDQPAGSPTIQMGAPVNNPPPPAPAEYPRCSKTVTDQCVQRGGR